MKVVRLALCLGKPVKALKAQHAPDRINVEGKGDNTEEAEQRRPLYV